MAASNSILKLQVDDKQYEASLKSAQQGLQALMNALRNSGKSFSDLDKNTAQYVRALGNMEATAKTTRGRIGEMSSAFVELSQVEKQLTDQERQSPVGKALTESLNQLKQRTIEAKQELADLDKQLTNQKTPATTGGIFSGIGSKMEGALAVFGGNLMTKAAGAVANLGAEMADMVKQGIEMAKAGEGVRIAFERLGNGQILDGLREATHGTVTDLELMKAAVKFNDFKLPVEELGTMLAFAQQKAKDTGQSVDYMVDSIVTGLGRKSLMILDNLGLSANEIKERMKETGDMTKAVGDIIRDQMAKAGDYVETAADRAAQANVSLQNKMEELGRKFAPLEEASNSLWTSMKIGILDVVGGPLARLLNGLTEAGRLKNMLDDVNGGGNGKESRTDRALRMLREYSGGGRGIEGKRDLYNRQVASYNSQEEKAWREVNRLREELKGLRSQQKENGLAGNIQPLISETSRQLEAAENRAKAIQIMRANYQKGAEGILNPSKNIPLPTPNPTNANKIINQDKDDFKEVEEIVGLLNLQKQKLDDLQAMKPFAESEEEIVRLNKEIEKANTEYQRLLNLGKEKPIEIATGTSIQNNAGMSAYIASTKKQLETADYGTSLYKGLSAQLADMSTLQNLVGESLKAGLGTAMFDVADETGADFWTRAMEGGVANIDWQTIVDKINEARKAAGLDTINLDFTTGSINTDKGDKNGKRKKNQFLHENEDGKQEAKVTEVLGGLAGGMQQMLGGLEQLGIDIPAGLQNVVGGIQLVSTILTSIMTIVSAIEAISAADAIIPFANGGIVGRAAGGMLIPGNSFSGDNLRMPVVGGGMIGVNSGEVILNQAQAGVIANALEGGGMQNLQLEATIRGEDIKLALNNNSRRTGRGEYVTTRFKKE